VQEVIESSVTRDSGRLGTPATVGSAAVKDVPRVSSKCFKLHIGANLSIPGVENLTRVAVDSGEEEQLDARRQGEGGGDPFHGLPLYQLAEYLGERVMPALEAVKEEQLKQKREAQLAGEQQVGVTIPYIPPLLPVTRWASQDAQFRSTLVVDDGEQKKARLSWYHPDDTMVPRDWFSKGLVEDLKYYSPFGLFSSK